MKIIFWKDGVSGRIDPELFSTTADKLAAMVSREKSRETNKYTQIRKFYDEVIRFKNNNEDFELILPYIKMLNAKAAYARGRSLISDSFKEFISDSLKQVNTRADFDVFANLFESFMGYYKFYDKQAENQGGRR